ncbi:Acyl-CoA N-acyltransferase [Akanthomyces lecanii RCEF 1005]|uniref:Acyl-CoA N-acyltransferase n=1 Tax=Akanthomyces lecanii RCEF 1005 TaxID=1081108 RepID=A0A168H2N1_CORDF|nr:Acyl-CoA N-acyltransferase [Akanthomyces lecanii RCEF 1005]
MPLPITTLRRGLSTYTLRPGLFADVPSFAHVYYDSFSDTRPGASTDNLMDILFGDFRSHPRDTRAVLAAMLAPRLWSLQYRMSALVDDATDEVVGFVCVKRPATEISFYERWLSPQTWLHRLYTVMHSIASFIRPPGAALDTTQAASFTRAFVDLEPQVRCSPRRRAAWYLSIVAVLPGHQGRGLGGAMLRAALDHIDAVGARQPLQTPNDAGSHETEATAAAAEGEEVDIGGPAVWLTARKGTEGLYRRFGFVKVMDSNKGPLSAWNGGAVMFRGLRGVVDLS